MNQATFEELLVAAAERPTAKNLDNLLQSIRRSEGGISQETAEQLHLLWETWNADNMDDEGGLK